MSSLGRLSSSRPVRLGLALAGVLALGVAAADARTGSGSNSGSRGARSSNAPPATNTAPKPAQPLERSVTPGAGSAGPAAAPAAQAPRPAVAPAAQAARPAAAMAQAKPKSPFAGGFGSMLMGGLIGAGLFGLLSGHGLFGGMAGMASILGLVLQAGLIIGAIWLVMSLFRGRRQPAMAGMGAAGMGTTGMGAPGMMRQASAEPMARQTYSNGGGAAAAGMGAGAALAVGKDDFDEFERLLGLIQDAYGREDKASLRDMTTSEMLGFLSDDLAANASKGLRNNVIGAKLLQGDLSESWREGSTEFATVAMRYELIDSMVERSTGRVVSGHAQIPQEVTEIWTFQRRTGSGAGGWRLGAIQQVD